jgi:Leucine-rich repeat (LRR) protein
MRLLPALRSLSLLSVCLSGFFSIPAAHAADVTFADPNLLLAIEETFAVNAWPLSSPPQDTELARPEFTRLDASLRTIDELTGLEACTALTYLDLSGNAITDLTPLSGLSTLEELRVGRNQISDISPLAGLTNLRGLALGLGFNPLFEEGKGQEFEPPFTNFNLFTSLAPISGLTNLEQLELVGVNQLTSMDEISGFDRLEQLLIGYNDFEDLDILSTCADTLKLFITIGSELQNEDIALLATFQNLFALGLLIESDVTDLSPLSALNLEYFISLANPNITDGSFLEGMSNLIGFGFVETPVTAAPNLSGIPGPLEAGFEFTALADVSGLANSNISSLYIQGAPLTNLNGLESVTGIISLDLLETQVSNLQPLVDNPAIGGPIQLILFDNPLSQEAACVQLPLLRARIEEPGHLNTNAFCGEPFFLTVNVTGVGTTTLGVGTFGLEPGKFAGFGALPIESSDYAFSHWEGDIGTADSDAESINILMDADKTVTAVFVTPGDHTLSIAQNALQNATITPGIGTFSYLDGRYAQVNANPNGDFSYFAGWSGDVVSPFYSVRVLMDADKAIVANFVGNGFRLSLEVVGNGGIDQMYSGEFAYALGMEIPLSGIPNTGWRFLRWEGDIGAADPLAPSISVTMNQDRTIRLVLEQGDRTLTIGTGGTGSGTTNPSPGNYPYFDTDTAFVSATPGPNSYFVGWEGDIGDNDPLNPFLNLPMSVDRAVTAVFGPAFLLTVQSTGAGATFPFVGVYPYAAGQQAALTANPVFGGGFLQWEGDLAGAEPTSPTLSLTMDQDRTVTAVFVPYDWTVTLSKTGTGEISPEGTLGFFDGATLPLRATPLANSGYAFAGWEGDLVSTALDETLLVDSDKTITGVFVESEDLLLTLDTSPGGTTLPEPGVYAFSPGQLFQAGAEPEFGYAFASWTGNVGAASPGSNPIVLAMDQSRSITATFTELTTYELTLNQTGTGTTVPTSGSTYTYLDGQAVLLLAFANEGSGQVFERWSGDIGEADPQNPRITVPMNQDRVITAQFAVADWQLSLEVLGTGAVTPTPGDYPHFDGDLVTVQASVINGSGYHFTGWAGDLGGQDPAATSITLTMDRDRDIQARFEPDDAVRCQQVQSELAPYLSSAGTGYAVYDSFSGVAAPIGGLRWWGIHAVDPVDGPFQPCTRTPDNFEVLFFADDQGAPGALVYREVFTGLNGVNTGQKFFDYDIKEYAVTLGESFRLAGGWLSIRGVDTEDCWFLWGSSNQDDARTWQQLNGGALVQKAGDSAFCLIEGDEPVVTGHAADQNGDGVIGLSELLRVIQFYNLSGYGCDEEGNPSEDGYLPGPGGAQDCPPHSSDYNPQDWDISLSELLRLIQFYNNLGFEPCNTEPPTEDGFCLVTE